MIFRATNDTDYISQCGDYRIIVEKVWASSSATAVHLPSSARESFAAALPMNALSKAQAWCREHAARVTQ